MRRIALSVAAAIAFVAILALLFGPRGAAVGAAIAFLGLAWRHDNETGVCLPLAVLFLLVVGVLLLLLFLLVMARPR